MTPMPVPMATPACSAALFVGMSETELSAPDKPDVGGHLN